MANNKKFVLIKYTQNIQLTKIHRQLYFFKIFIGKKLLWGTRTNTHNLFQRIDDNHVTLQLELSGQWAQIQARYP
jgi:hypothetical protein